jgi:hypothetical protein
MDKSKPSYYGILPAHVRYDNDLPPMARIMYAEITALSNKDGYCSAGNDYFAKLYDVSTVTVSRWISKLGKQGYISIDADPVTGHDRKLYPLNKNVIPHNKNVKAPIQKDQGPLNKNVKHNSTSIILQDNINIEGENEFSPAPAPKKKVSRFIPPTLEECISAFKEKLREKKVLGADAIAQKEGNKFFNTYSSKGWMVGKNKMKSWPHAVAGWIGRMDDYKTVSNKLKPNEGAISTEDAHAIIANIAENGW